MKIIKYFAIIGYLSALALTSCDEYEAVPIERFTLDYVFSPTDSLGRNAEKYLNGIYYALQNGHNRVGGDYLDAASDDAISSAVSENDIQRLAAGQYTAANRVGVGRDIPNRITGDMDWAGYYTSIRQAITFINNIDVVPLMQKLIKNVRDTTVINDAGENIRYQIGDTIPMTQVWKAEARFLKAYFYFELVKRYGGVPILRDDAPYELGDDMELPRNTFKYCIDYIVSELDTIKNNLRAANTLNSAAEAHVVTQGAAMALKCRVLLYAASPLFNERPVESGNELVGYAQYDRKRWKTAADAARWFIDTYNKNSSVYALYTALSNIQFRSVFWSYYGGSNKEIIFAQQGSKGKDIEKNNGPIGFTGNNQSNGRTSPTQNLVDAFPMKNGKSIDDPASGYDPQNMYAQRDSRLEYTVMYNGSKWLKTPLETYINGKNNPNQSAQTTKTSYYMKKFMGDFVDTESYDDVIHLWVMFRYAEILLNFAEAENEYSGPTSEVYAAITKLRSRVRISSGADGLYGLKANMTQDEMRKVIQNERRIEMAFEEQRYWDIRRWRIAEDIFAQPLYGLQITKNGGVLNYTQIEVANYSFDTKRYFYPIPYSEVVKNKNMVQNPGW
ncbi:MAG: RagB/SusD family nutrient uptake outer membrane protein [Dysgonamonadaceae bacterium]|jgi:hypothetical protein|nr:RagB/SusD family nutrient uptake outer membrane protein [Dysgonamonadaceae bacterium]